MGSCLRLSRPLIQTLTIIHMLPKIIQLRFIKLRREVQISHIFEILQRSTHTRNHGIDLRSLQHNSLQWLKATLQLIYNCRFVKQVVVLVRRFGVRVEDSAEK
jgi:hypothetical protein